MDEEISKEDEKRLEEMEKSLGTTVKDQRSIRSENKKSRSSKLKRLAGVKKLIKKVPLYTSGGRPSFSIKSKKLKKHDPKRFDTAMSEAILKEFHGKDEIQTFMQRRFFDSAPNQKKEVNFFGDPNKILPGNVLLSDKRRLI